MLKKTIATMPKEGKKREKKDPKKDSGNLNENQNRKCSRSKLVEMPVVAQKQSSQVTSSPGNKVRKSSRVVKGKIFFDEMQENQAKKRRKSSVKATNNNATVCIADVETVRSSQGEGEAKKRVDVVDGMVPDDDSNSQQDNPQQNDNEIRGDGILLEVDAPNNEDEEELDYHFSDGDFEDDNGQTENAETETDSDASNRSNVSMTEEQKLLEQNPGLRRLFN